MQSASLGCKWSLELLFALIVFKQINAIVVFQTEWLYITKIKSAKWEETALKTLIWSEFWNVLCIVKSSKQLVEKNILFSQGHMFYSDPLATVPEVRIHLVYLSSLALHTQPTRTSAIIREKQRQKMVRRGEKYYISVISSIRNLFPSESTEVSFWNNTSVPFLNTGERNLDGIFFFWKMRYIFCFKDVFVVLHLN